MFKSSSHFLLTYLRHRKTLGDLFQWVLGAFAMDHLTYSNWHKMQSELAQFSYHSTCKSGNMGKIALLS